MIPQSKSLDEKTKQCVLTAYLIDSVENIGEDTVIPLNGYRRVGEKLKLQNNSIIIGSGVSHVKISANVFAVQPSYSQTYTWFSIRKNNVEYAISIASPNSNYTSVVLSEKLIDVSEGDIIDLFKKDNNLSTIRGGANTWLTVECVD